ncbi:SDR family NAD(P)-dependent oxidoreductase [Actinokineospora bangkokensis]|uniref:6-deoxyerythronolide-B synthase n=1 Tax=Actinokineospora bangkokensis TaxID=1193682 RepID=A0A1Q9LS25_9PSEU|nr:SDR family NAD(P)-dependent oxidoreductase [Actinokineospora bangkokensis]OLR94818.1 6-deoxyerythronolide-B synthase [Actinokineospora bangkokensis]
MTHPPERSPAHAVLLSATDADQLAAVARLLREHVATRDPAVAEVAYTTQVGRIPLRHRAAVRCATAAELLSGLDAVASGGAAPGVAQGVASGSARATASEEWDAAVEWVGGAAVDWRALWPARPRRVALPGYPFRRETSPRGGAVPVSPDLLDRLVALYAEVSGVPAERVDAHARLTDLGLSSFVITRLNARLEAELGVRSRTLFFEHATLAEVAAALTAKSTVEPAPVVARAGSGAIAVIGIAGRYPGSPDLDAFWDNLVHGRDCVTPLPADRARPSWPVELMEGGYLASVDRFDPLLFGITPRDAALMDPQERQFLEVTWEALESAGYTRARLRERHASSVGVYAGAMWNEYPLFGAESTALGSPQDSGATLGGVANRVSYFYDLRGPSLTVDTMCSSALVALDLAVGALRRGEVEVAISGAVSLSLHPNKFRQQQRMSLTATDHRSHSFGKGGDGFAPAEGVGVVVLKPLERALADGDPVHAVVRGTAVVHAGRTNGFLVPSPAAQAEVVGRALRAAGTDPAEVGYVEAHGAGTALGDPVEVDGLTRAFGDRPAGSVPIGSVKSTIGHAEAAAGLAGLTKVVLQLRHGTLAPSLHAEELNPDIDWASVPFRVQRAAAHWSGPRVAGISSFGAGGTIAHAVVAAAPERAAVAAPAGPQVVVLSAYDADRLDELVGRLRAFLGEERGPDPARLLAVVRAIAAGEAVDAGRAAELLAGSGPALADLAFTLQVGREPLRQRLAVVVSDLAELRECLADYRNDPRVLLGRAPGAVDPTAVPSEGAGPQELAAHWVAGGVVDWERRHEPGRSIVPLPAYPFARVRCWVPEPAQLTHATQPVQPAATAEVPLLGKEWVPEPAPVAPAPLGRVLCLGGDAGMVADLGGTPVRDEVGLRAALAGGAPVSGVVDLPGNVPWQARVAVLRALVRERPRDALRIVHVAGADVRTAAAVRVLAAEHTRVTATVLDTDACSADQVRAEWAVADAVGEVRYRAGVRYRPRLVAVDAPWVPLGCDPAGAYLVTGGTRGTGAVVARHLVDRGARVVALVGVRESTAVADELGARGVRVLRHAGGFAGVEAFLDEVRAVAPLRGVVHCAGIGSRGGPAFAHGDPADLDAVLAPKLDGLERLAAATADDRLAFFLVFSSVCASVPALAAGVGDYAVANLAADAVVRGLVASGRAEFRSVDWPQWAESGSTSGLPNPCAPVGIAPLTDAAGLRVVDRVLALPTGTVVLPCPPLAGPVDPAALITTAPRETGDAAPVEPRQQAGGWLVELFSEALGIPVPDLDPTAEFGDLGVDSVLLGELLLRVESRLGRAVDPSAMIVHPTLERLAAHLGVDLAAAPAPAPAPAPVPVPAPVPAALTAPAPSPVPAPQGHIAIIGMACRFPGADTPAQFWDNLLAGRDSVGEVPASRWDASRWWSPTPELGRSISRWGGFVDGVEWFDPAAFDLTEDEARCLDPAIRLLLEGTAECVAEAGYTPAELRGRRVAVVAGARLSDYGRRVPVRTDVLRSDQNFIAARVAHQFDLRGPNLVVDSACSSSLVAVQVACRSLLAGESELAVVGGVEVLVDPETYVDLSAARALSPTGRCRVFDSSADGFVPGEGCGVLLLKPLAAALRDGDRVHAVIESVAVNNDGRTMGVTTPNPAAQADVVRQALAMAGRDPAEVGLLEAHGTGTLIGDPIELRGLTEVFGGVPGPVRLGSVKSNVGHLLSAAGMAGVVKVALSLAHGRIPPTLHCDRPNPRFDFASSPLTPVTSVLDWPAGPRVAGVSSFGLGGTNAHLVASAPPPSTPTRVPLPRPRFDRRRLWLDHPDERPTTQGEPLVASLLALDLTTRD